MALRKVVCATDFSPASARALKAAIAIAKQHDASLVISNAWQVPANAYGEMGIPTEVTAEMSGAAAKALEEAVVEGRAAGIRDVSSALLLGPPWQAIVEHLQQDPTIDLAVVGTHGRGGVLRVLLGSVAEQIVRHAPCNVLAVHLKDAPPPYRSVLLPVDFSSSTPHALTAALSIASTTLARLALVHVVDKPFGYQGEAIGQFEQRMNRQGEDELAAFTKRTQADARIEITGRTRLGSPSRQILEELETGPAFDLVVMGSHGRSGIRRAVLGSVAEAVIRHAPCSVLVTRQR
ncbi:universal stress protein [soil metagenome]